MVQCRCAAVYSARSSLSSVVHFEGGADGAFQSTLDPGGFEGGVVAGEMDAAFDRAGRRVVFVQLTGGGDDGFA